MSAEPGDGAPEAPRRLPSRRRRILSLVTVLALVSLGLLVHWASRPRQVADALLAQAGQALGLRITARGVAEYTLRGAPQIVLRDVEARMPGDPAALLRARRVSIALPWSTLRSRGRDLVIQRIELDAPRLDIAALQRWQATRPPTVQTRVPRLTDGFVVRDGRVDGPGWHVAGISIDAPMLAPDAPVRGAVSGEVVTGETRIPFDVRATLARPAEHAGLGVAGRASVIRPDWRVELEPVLRGRVRLGDRIGLDRFAMQARALYANGNTRLPFAFGLAGQAVYRDGLTVAPAGVVLRGDGPMPDLAAGGEIAWSKALQLSLSGELQRWPSGWPELPAPVGRPRGALPFALDYDGPMDLSGRTELDLRHGATRVDAGFHLPRVLEWLESDAGATPLPPIDGRVSTPRLELPGVTLHGVEVEFDDAAE